MPRRTPLLALILAPFVLVLAVASWQKLLAPAWHEFRYSDVLLGWQLSSDRPARRIAALGNLRVNAHETELAASVTSVMATDPEPEVRTAALQALGQIGAAQALPEASVEALVAMALQSEEDPLLKAAFTTLGLVSARNEIPDPAIRRIADAFEQPHAPMVDDAAAKSLGRIGANQDLPPMAMNTLGRIFDEPRRRGQSDSLARTFRTIAQDRRLPVAILDRIAAAVSDDHHPDTRKALLYALAYEAAHYPAAQPLLERATADARRDVAEAAQHGLRIAAAERVFGGTTPLAVAVDRGRPRDERVRAIEVLRGGGFDEAAFPKVVELAADPDPAVAATALSLFRYIARAPDHDFDRERLIPALEAGFDHEDEDVRLAAVSALSTIRSGRHSYRRAERFEPLIAAATRDPAPAVRRVAFATQIRTASTAANANRVLERALSDPAPLVRANAIGWLGSDRIAVGSRERWFEQAAADPDAQVRAAANEARARWRARDRGPLHSLWMNLKAGNFGELGAAVFVGLTLLFPALLCAGFFIYTAARALAYVMERRWRGLATLPVFAIWGVATYAIGMLYFMLGHAGNPDFAGSMQLAAVAWAGNAIYAALAWSLRFAIRR